MSISSLTPVTVTLCPMFQLPAVKVRVCVSPAVPPSLLTVAALASLEVTLTVTVALGCVASCTP